MNRNSTIETKGSRPGFFERSETDVLMTALLETMSQLWVTRGRLENLEKAIIDNAILSPEQIQKATANEEHREQKDEALQNFLADAFRASSASLQSLDARQREVDRFQSADTEQS